MFYCTSLTPHPTESGKWLLQEDKMRDGYFRNRTRCQWRNEAYNMSKEYDAAIVSDNDDVFNIRFFTDNGAMIYNENPPKYLFKDFIISKYGRGYSLKPPQGHKDIGIKYYYKAWWAPYMNKWFLRKEVKDYFINHGATEQKD